MNSISPFPINAYSPALQSVKDTDPMIAAYINLDAIENNTRYLCSLASHAQMMAVVKADGYGHGAVHSARAAIRGGASCIGVATIAEAQQLRAAGISVPILAWLLSPQDDFTIAVADDITVALSSLDQLKAVISAAKILGRTALVEIKVDTGLRRNGLAIEQWDDFGTYIGKAIAEQSIELQGVFTHLSHADQPDSPITSVQLTLLADYVESLSRAQIDPGIVHCANTAATLSRPDTHLDRVRSGLGIFGYSPILGDFPLIPALSLQVEIIAVRKISPGDGVSYRHRWSAQKSGYVALLPIGYADGLSRSLGGKISVVIKGRAYQQVGTICMDQCVIDLGNNEDNIIVGDRALLLTDGSDGAMSVDDWAKFSGTINYEIITLLRGRTSRIYHGKNISIQ